MMDPSFDNGLDRDSVVDMVYDISKVYLNNMDFVTAPRPIEGAGPSTHIKFRGDCDYIPEDLEINKKRSSKGSVSRRSQSYNVRNVVRPERSISMSVRDKYPIDEITLDIDNAIKLAQDATLNNHLSDGEYSIDEEDNEIQESTNFESPREIPPPQNDIIGRPAGRRIVRRGVSTFQ